MCRKKSRVRGEDASFYVKVFVVHLSKLHEESPKAVKKEKQPNREKCVKMPTGDCTKIVWRKLKVLYCRNMSRKDDPKKKKKREQEKIKNYLKLNLCQQKRKIKFMNFKFKANANLKRRSDMGTVNGRWRRTWINKLVSRPGIGKT